MNPYQVLGINESADTATIKDAYRKLARQHHPDRGGDVEKFKEATEAYSILSDDQKRHQYNNPPQNFGFEDLFGQEFNPFANVFNQRAARPRQVQPNTQDRDIQFNLKINLEQVKQGAYSTISYKKNSTCTDCNGNGGDGKMGCSHCGGSGRRMFRPNPSIIQQVVCSSCDGRGVLFENPCNTCQTHGFVQKIEEITMKIEEVK